MHLYCVLQQNETENPRKRKNTQKEETSSYSYGALPICNAGFCTPGPFLFHHYCTPPIPCFITSSGLQREPAGAVEGCEYVIDRSFRATRHRPAGRALLSIFTMLGPCRRYNLAQLVLDALCSDSSVWCNQLKEKDRSMCLFFSA
jgi:hypothetical protein